MSQPTEQRPGIVMYSTTWCGDCRRAKRWLNDNHIPYTDINIEEDPAAAAYVRQVNNGMSVVPTIVFPDGAVLTEPTNAALAQQVERSRGTTSPDAERAR